MSKIPPITKIAASAKIGVTAKIAKIDAIA